jgi:hypothetical protein
LSRVLARAFFGSSILNAGLSAVNLLTIIMLVRWFGATTYAHYIVDLALLGLMLIVLEVVPSNYSLFRIQDDPFWQRCVAAQLIITIVVAGAIVVATGTTTNSVFKDYSPWMALYAGTVAIKRYLDIRLQSSGRLVEYLGVEFSSAVVRLALLAAGSIAGVAANSTVWGSLAVATLVSQLVWWARNPGELSALRGVTDVEAWRMLVKHSPHYVPYYLGIGLKRLRDNLVPLLGAWLFSSKEMLAMFLLAYRGVAFAVGQVRIIESLLIHRATIDAIDQLSERRRLVIAATAQTVCLLASGLLLVSSGLKNLPWVPTVVLSFMIWPIAFFTLERAKAYSKFRPALVNSSMVGYVVAAASGTIFLKLSGISTVTNFAWVLVLAETSGFAVIKTIGGYRSVSQH